MYRHTCAVVIIVCGELWCQLAMVNLFIHEKLHQIKKGCRLQQTMTTDDQVVSLSPMRNKRETKKSNAKSSSGSKCSCYE